MTEEIYINRRVDTIKKVIRSCVIQTGIKKVSILVILSFLLIISCEGISSAADRFSKTALMGEDESPWQITADSLTYKNDEQIYVAKGGVVITKNGQSLYAREAIYNIKTGIARVTGDVKLVVEEDILRGEEGYFDLKKQTGRITNGTLFLGRNHYYIDSEVMEKIGEDTYLIKNCRLTTCDGDKPAWAITGSEVKITVEGYGTILPDDNRSAYGGVTLPCRMGVYDEFIGGQLCFRAT